MNVAAPNILRFPRAWFDATRDSFQNFLAGFGVPGRDKAMSQLWAYYPLTVDQLEAAYNSDWVARKIIEIPAFDATRAWRLWQADKEEKKQIEDAEKKYNLQRKLLDALIKARLYGGSAIILGVDQGTFQEELDLDKVGKDDLKFVHVVSRYALAAGPTVKEITSPWYGHPTYYQRSNVVTVAAPGGVAPIGEPTMGQAPGDQLYIHPSRVIRLVGLDYPDMERAPDAWGVPVLQPVADALKSAGMVTSSMAAMIAEAKLDIIKVPGLTNKMQTAEGTQSVLTRFMQANVAKSSINALLLDKEEEWERHQLQLSNYDKVMSSYFLLCCAAADVPATRFMGREPAGQNATGDSDTRNYYDRLASDQKVRQTPALRPLDEVLLRSTFGHRDDAWSYDWNALWLMSDAEKADVELKKAQAHKVDVDAGLLSPHVLQIGRENSLVESGFLYPGIETAIDDEADWDAEEGVQEARTKGMMDPNDPDVIEAKGKVAAASKPPPFGGGRPNGGGKPKPRPNGGGARDSRNPFRRLAKDAPPPAVIFEPTKHPHDPKTGQWATTVTGDPLQMNPEVVAVGGDDWNQKTAGRLEFEYARIKPVLDQLAEKVSEAGEGVELDEDEDEDEEHHYTPESWDELSSDQQEEAKSKWKEATFSDYKDSEIQNQYDSGYMLEQGKRDTLTEWKDAPTKHSTVSGETLEWPDWASEAIDEVIEEHAEAGKRIRFTKDQLLKALTIDAGKYDEFGGDGSGDPDVGFDDSELTDPAGYDPSEVFPGFEKLEPSSFLTEDERDDITKAITDAFNKEGDSKADKLDAGDYIDESTIDDYQDETWEHSYSDQQKWEYAEQYLELGEQDSGSSRDKAEPEVPRIPKQFMPLANFEGKDGPQDYKSLRALSHAMSRARAAELIEQRSSAKGRDAELDAIGMDNTLWRDWKSSSTSPNGRLLQLAIADELGGRLNKTQIGEKPENISGLHKMAEQDWHGGYDAVLAYVRAKWETTQWMLDKANVAMVDVYRGLRMGDKLKNEQTKEIEFKTVTHGIDAKAKQYPNAVIRRNGASSWTTDRNIANGWGDTTLRAQVPRTAFVSVPVYGQNIHTERESIIAGTAWKGWDAWKGAAPDIKDVPIAQWEGATP
jgi:hypothetical protein